jgi:uncharacterized membrane protein
MAVALSPTRFRMFPYLALLAVLAALCIALIPATVDAKELHWDRYDVTIDVNADGSLRITEDQDISFDEGFFSEGFAVIPLARVEEIDNVQLSENGQPYERALTYGVPGTFTVEQVGGDLEILWWFAPANAVNAPEIRNFTINYDVTGGLRVYNDPPTNQLWWRAIDEDFSADIDSSTITVNLPDEVTPENLVIGAFTRGYDADQVQIEQINGDTIVFQANNIDQGDSIEARVTFPPLTSASVPAWQAADDERREREERLEPYRALANVLFLGAGLLLAVGGPLGLYAVWHNYGRDTPVAMPLDILREPPSDLPAGTVGTLIDERADIHDLIATLVDLAERDVIHIEETSSEILGINYNRDWTISKIGETDSLTKAEQALVRALFGSKDEVKLKAVRQSFGKQQGKVRTAFYEELVQRGYFPSNPEKVRRNWRIGGFVMLGGIAFIGFQLWSSVGSFAPFAIAVLIGLGVTGLALLIAAGFMPRKTPQGAEAAARWIAFRRYLEEIEKYDDLQQAQEIFARYLPYAVAFSIETSWVRKFASVDTPAPRWYGPRHGRTWPHNRPVIVGTGGGGGLDMPNMPSLDSMSEGFAGSLQGMSDGLFNMFKQASSSFSPYSESSGGGRSGGFGGGGGSFGGGGGGGGRGFR